VELQITAGLVGGTEIEGRESDGRVLDEHAFFPVDVPGAHEDHP
jgi:hypothetical protein